LLTSPVFSPQADETISHTYKDRYVTVTRWEAPASGLTPRYTVMNLLEVGAYFASTLYQLATSNVTELSNPENPLINSAFYEGSRSGAIHETLFDSTTLGYSSVISRMNNIEYTQIAVFVSMAVLTVVIEVFVFIPILWSIEKSSDGIMLSFIALPPPVRKGLWTQAFARVRLLRRNFSDEDDEDDDGFDDEEEEEGNGALMFNDNGLGAYYPDLLDRGVSAAAIGGHGRGPPPFVIEGLEGNNAMVVAGSRAGGGMMGLLGPNDDPEASANLDWQKMMSDQLSTSSSSQGKLPLSASYPPISKDLASAVTTAVATRRGSVDGSSSNPGSINSVSIPVAGGASAAPPPKKLRKSRSFKERTYRKSGRSFSILLFKFTLPLILLLVLFSTVFGVFMVTLQTAKRQAAVTTAADVRAESARQTMVDVRRVITTPADPGYINRQSHYILASADSVVTLTRLLGFADAKDRDELIADGDSPFAPYVRPVEDGSDSGVLSADSQALAHDIFYDDLCQAVGKEFTNKVPGFTVQRCEAFGGGILKQGLSGLIEKWNEVVSMIADRQIRRRYWRGQEPTSGYDWPELGYGYLIPGDKFNYTRDAACLKQQGCDPYKSFAMPADGSALPPTEVPAADYAGDVLPPPAPAPYNNSELYSVAAELQHPLVQFLLEADSLYLHPALEYISVVYASETTSTIDDFLTFLVWFLSVYLVFFVLFMVLFFWPQVKKVNREIQTHRSMLLFLPIQVIAKIRTLKKLVDDILNKSSSSSADQGKTISTLSVKSGRSVDSSR
jgi:hypothetical protein